MELKVFSDLIDALGKVANGVKAIANLTKDQREEYQQTLAEPYRLINATVTMVIIRLGDIRLLPDDEFMNEVARLDNCAEWLQTEREFRLCRGLRAALREAQTFYGKVKGKVSTQDWDALLQQMQSILAAESEVAMFISDKFSALATAAQSAIMNATGVGTLRAETEAFRQALIAERTKLVTQEADLYTIT